MEYLHLKEQLSKILNDDVQNRQSIQEFRRNVFLNSENSKKHEQVIFEKEFELDRLNEEIKKIEDEKIKKSSQAEELKFQLDLQKGDFEQRENGLLDLINSLKTEIELLKDSHTELTADQSHLSKLSLQNAEYASKIRDLIYHIDSQNEKEELLQNEINELNNSLLSTQQLSAGLKSEVSSLVKTNEEINSLKNELLQISDENKKLQNENSYQIIQIEKLNTDLKELQQAQLDLIRENNLLQDTFKSEHQLMQKDNADLIAEIGLIKLQLEDLTVHNDTLQNELLKLSELENELNSKNEIIVSLNNELNNYNELKDKNENLNSLVDSLNEKLENHSLLLKEHLDLQTNFQKLQSEFNDLNEEQLGISEIRNELFSLNDQIAQKNLLISSFEVEKNKLLAEIENSKLNSEFKNELEAKISELSNETEIQQNELNIFKEKTKELTAELEFEKSNLNLIISDLKNQLNEKKTEINNSSDEAFIDKLFKQIDLLNDENSVLSTENDEISDNLNYLNEKYHSLSQIIENQKNEIIGLEERNKKIKLATELKVSDEENSDLKLKINELVREIDRCIALLSE
jgi:chromosome segregation ATPase